MKTLVIVKDWYDGCELLYRGDSIEQGKKAIKDRIDDTSGECSLTVSVLRKYTDFAIEDVSFTRDLANYIDEYTETVLATL